MGFFLPFSCIQFVDVVVPLGGTQNGFTFVWATPGGALVVCWWSAPWVTVVSKVIHQVDTTRHYHGRTEKVHHKLFWLCSFAHSNFFFLLSIFICQSSHTVSGVGVPGYRGGSRPHLSPGRAKSKLKLKSWFGRSLRSQFQFLFQDPTETKTKSNGSRTFGHECRSNVFCLLFYNFKYANNGHGTFGWLDRCPTHRLIRTWPHAYLICVHISRGIIIVTRPPQGEPPICHDLWEFFHFNYDPMRS